MYKMILAIIFFGILGLTGLTGNVYAGHKVGEEGWYCNPEFGGNQVWYGNLDGGHEHQCTCDDDNNSPCGPGTACKNVDYDETKYFNDANCYYPPPSPPPPAPAPEPKPAPVVPSQPSAGQPTGLAGPGWYCDKEPPANNLSYFYVDANGNEGAITKCNEGEVCQKIDPPPTGYVADAKCTGDPPPPPTATSNKDPLVTFQTCYPKSDYTKHPNSCHEFHSSVGTCDVIRQHQTYDECTNAGSLCEDYFGLNKTVNVTSYEVQCGAVGSSDVGTFYAFKCNSKVADNCPAASPSPSASPNGTSSPSSPSPSPSPSSSPKVYTDCFKIAESEQALDDATCLPYTDHPLEYPLTLQPPLRAGDVRVVFVRFKSTDGTQRTFRRTIRYSPDPKITNADCHQSATGVGTAVTIKGEHFGSKGKGKVVVSGKELQNVNWNPQTDTITGTLDERLEGTKPVKVTIDDGREATGSCTVDITTVEFETRTECKKPGQQDAEGVEVKVFEAVPQTTTPEPILRQKIKLDKSGKPQGFTPKLERGKNYALLIKAPGTLAKKVDFKAEGGTKVLDPITLPVGDIAPATSRDGKVNSVDKGELVRQWSIAKDVTRTGDFNKDLRVSSPDYSCLLKNFNAEDEVYIPPKEASPSPSLSPSSSTGGISVTTNCSDGPHNFLGKTLGKHIDVDTSTNIDLAPSGGLWTEIQDVATGATIILQASQRTNAGPYANSASMHGFMNSIRISSDGYVDRLVFEQKKVYRVTVSPGTYRDGFPTDLGSPIAQKDFQADCPVDPITF